MRFFRISKWETYQHYHKPRPKWIKLYTSINDQGTDWRELSDAEIGQVVRLMAYAALNENAMPFHAEMLQEMVGFDTELDLRKFKKLGVITVFKDKASCLSRENPRAMARDNSIVPSSEVRGQSSEERDRDKNEESSCLTSGEVTQIKDFPDEVKYIANILAQGMADNDPRARLPKTDKQRDSWLDSIEKIHRLDGREWDVIESVTRWCQQDDFWKSNILSASKLRKQFPQLLAKMSCPAKPTGRFGNQEQLLKTLKELNDGEPKEGTCWDSPSIQRTDDGRKGGRLLSGT